MLNMYVSDAGYRVCRSFEGRSLKAYRDAVGVWTIGYGSTNADAELLGFLIKAGVTITEEQAEALLKLTAQRRYIPAVNKALDGTNPSQAAFDAGFDFDYNTGAIARASWVKSFAASNLQAVHSNIMLWNKAGGHVLAGLTRRRNREWEMIASGDYGPEGRDTSVHDQNGKPVAPTKPVPQIEIAPTEPEPAWLTRMDALLGLYEAPGAADNPAIIAMAQACGGAIARDYKHDATPWCALTMNYCLVTTGYKGTDSLAALSFRAGTQRLNGPVVGAIGTLEREGGGHVFVVRGRTADGRIVGVGGNQSDMVCDEVFDPAVCQFGWPKAANNTPVTVGINTLPLVTPRPKTHKDFTALPGEHPALQNAHPPGELQGTPGMLHLGDKGPEVAQVKGLLANGGYNLSADKPDEFGKATDAAVRDFQRKHKQLEVTGYMDPATRAALQRLGNAKGTIGGIVKGGVATETTTGAVHAATHSVSTYVFLALGIAVVALVLYNAWKYRDEIRANWGK